MKWIKSYGHALNESKEQEKLTREICDAALRGNLSDVKDLLDRGAQIDATDKYRGGALSTVQRTKARQTLQGFSSTWVPRSM